MGAATLRRGRKEVHRPTRLPSVSGADHRRALTDLRREMGIEVLEAKKAGGFSQDDVDAAVAEAVLKVLDGATANAEAPAEQPPEATAEDLQALNANDLIEHIQGLETTEEVDAVMMAEANGKSRKGVLKACAEHIEWLNTPD